LSTIIKKEKSFYHFWTCFSAQRYVFSKKKTLLCVSSMRKAATNQLGAMTQGYWFVWLRAP